MSSISVLIQRGVFSKLTVPYREDNSHIVCARNLYPVYADPDKALSDTIIPDYKQLLAVLRLYDHHHVVIKRQLLPSSLVTTRSTSQGQGYRASSHKVITFSSQNNDEEILI